MIIIIKVPNNKSLKQKIQLHTILLNPMSQYFIIYYLLFIIYFNYYCNVVSFFYNYIIFIIVIDNSTF